MKRFGFLAIIVGGVSVMTFLIAQADDPPVTVFQVKHVLSGRESEACETESSEVELGTVTKIPIQTTVKSPDGNSTYGYREIRYYVPSPELMAKKNVGKDAESIVIGPQATCRIRTAPNGQLLLDVTLTETKTSIHDPQAGELSAETVQRRFVKPVELEKTVTFVWPALDEQTPPREISLTILDTK